jgi:hypothetical protein
LLKAEITGIIRKQLKTVDANIARVAFIFRSLKIEKNATAKMPAIPAPITRTTVAVSMVFTILYQKLSNGSGNLTKSILSS